MIKGVLTKQTTEKVVYSETKIPLNKFEVEGTSIINLRGGGEEKMQMDLYTVESDDLSKKDLFDNANDGQFGCESIQSIRINVYQQIERIREYLNEDNETFETKSAIILELIREDFYINTKDVK